MKFFSLPNLARTLSVHRIRWCFESLGASRTEAIPCSSSVGRHQWHEWRREQYRWASATVTFQENVQNKENFGDEWYWAILFDWAHRYCDKTQSFLLQILSQRRVCADSWSPRDFATFPRWQKFSAWPTSEVGDTKLGSAGLWGERHESSRSRAPAREDNEGSFGCETGSTHFRRTSLLTKLVRWTRILGWWRKFPPSLKCCVWVEVMS